MGAMGLVMDTHYRWGKGSIIRFVSHVLMGIALVLVGVLTTYAEVGDFALISSPWIIPIYLIGVTIRKSSTGISYLELDANKL